MMVVLGIVGGLVGGFVATNVLKIGSVDGINIESIVIATLGAIAVVFMAKLATGSGGPFNAARVTAPGSRREAIANSGDTMTTQAKTPAPARPSVAAASASGSAGWVVVLELDAEAADVPIDEVALSHEIRAPDGIENLVPGHDLPAPAGQEVEEALLDAAEVDH